MNMQIHSSKIFLNLIKKFVHYTNHTYKLSQLRYQGCVKRSFVVGLGSASKPKILHRKLRHKPPLSNSCCSAVSNKSETLKEDAKEPHTPVMASEVLDALRVKENGVYLDMTFGAGGHTQRILEVHPSVVVYGLDRDPHAIEFADVLKEQHPARFCPLLGKFSNLPELLHARGIGDNFFDGVVMDLGVSSMQFDTPQRGFMLSQDGPLDMRMDGDRGSDIPTAAEILYHIDEHSLYRVLKYYGQERRARAIARAVVDAREMTPSSHSFFRTTKELAEFVVGVTGVDRGVDKLKRFAHPATRTFQALRILVNDEMNELDCGLRVAHRLLRPQAPLAALSFHSLEDTILKRHFTGCDLDKTPDSIGRGLSKHHESSHLRSYSEQELEEEILLPWQPLTKGVVTPTQLEIDANPRSRSAKLRSASKVDMHSY